MTALSGVGEIQGQIADLKGKRKWFIILFLVFIVIPIPVSTLLFVQFETPDRITYTQSFFMSVQELTGINTNSSLAPRTSSGVALVAVLGILKLIFIGVVAALVIMTLEIELLKKKRGKPPPK